MTGRTWQNFATLCKIVSPTRTISKNPPVFHLQSTVVVEKSIQDLMNLMLDLSAYSNQFLEMVCDKLKEYKDICNTAYRYEMEV